MYTKKIFFLFVFAIGLLGIFGQVEKASAALGCCIQRHQDFTTTKTETDTGIFFKDTTTVESLNATPIGPDRAVGCYQVSGSQACSTGVVTINKECNRTDEPPAIGTCNSPATCRAQEAAIRRYNNASTRNYKCTFTEVKEVQVDCAAHPQCFSELASDEQCRNLNAAGCARNKACFWDDVRCQSRFDLSLCSKLTEKHCGTAEGSQACQWNKALGACMTKTEAQLGANRINLSEILPDCAVTGSCRSLNDILHVAVNVARKLFGIMGSLAFVMFIYGGVVMISSFGSQERFKKGQQVLVAAIIGIIIAFAAYLLIGYVLGVIGVQSELRAGVNVSTS